MTPDKLEILKIISESKDPEWCLEKALEIITALLQQHEASQ